MDTTSPKPSTPSYPNDPKPSAPAGTSPHNAEGEFKDDGKANKGDR